MDNTPASIQVLAVADTDVLERLGSVLRHLCVGMMDEPVRMHVLSRTGRDLAGDWVGPSRIVRLPRTFWRWRVPGGDEVLDAGDLEPPDVVHCFSPELAAWAHNWAMEWDSSLIVHLSDALDVRQFCDMRLAGRILAIATTPRLEQTVLDRCPDLRDSVRLVPHGLPAQTEPACLARPERIPAVLVTVPLTRDCGMENVFHSLHALVRAGQELQLFVLSSGPAEPMLRRLVEELGLRSNVTFAGPMREWSTLQDAMRSADFFILPTRRHRFTIHTLAAMASGLAVIAPAGTVEDYLINGTTACLFDAAHPSDLTRQWGALLEDRSRARELAHGALDHVRAHHQASTMVTSMAWLYREACRIPVSAAQV